MVRFQKSFSLNDFLRDMRRIFLLTIVYYITGKLSLMLSLPPGYITAFWPPAGIAVAALLLGGFRLFPGVWLGSFILNLLRYFDHLGAAPLELFITNATIIACGVTLQALAGVFLMQRFSCRPFTFERFSEIKGLKMAAAISSLISASVGLAALASSHIIDSSDYAFLWFAWWASGTIGILIFTPLILLLFQRGAQISLRRKVSVVVPFIGRHEQHALSRIFNRLARLTGLPRI